jgi:hypothetical protein
MRITNLDGILHIYAYMLRMRTRNKPYCRFAARGAYYNTENKNSHGWSDSRDKFTVHPSGKSAAVRVLERETSFGEDRALYLQATPAGQKLQKFIPQGGWCSQSEAVSQKWHDKKIVTAGKSFASSYYP